MASREYYDGKDNYVIFGRETGYGSGAVSTSNVIGKLQGISYTFNNNILIGQGVGEGANATTLNYGNFDVTGNITVNPTQFHFMMFGSGSVTGAGTAGNPYKLLEGDNIGYSGTFIPTAVFEVGAKGISNHQVYTLSGLSYNSWTLSGNVGEQLQATADFTAGSVTRSTSLSSVSGDGRSTFVFNSGSVAWNGEDLSCTAFSVTSNHPTNFPREVFNRFTKQPTKGVRRYTWTLTVNKHFDDASSQLSSNELLTEFFGNTNTPISSGTVKTSTLAIHIRDGTSTGHKNAVLQFENSVINDWAESPALEGGIISLTVNGVSLAGLTENGDNVPLRWWDA